MDKELLKEIKAYIERCEVQIEGEWGRCRSLDELIKDNEMPEVYNKVCNELLK